VKDPKDNFDVFRTIARSSTPQYTRLSDLNLQHVSILHNPTRSGPTYTIFTRHDPKVHLRSISAARLNPHPCHVARPGPESGSPSPYQSSKRVARVRVESLAVPEGWREPTAGIHRQSEKSRSPGMVCMVIRPQQVGRTHGQGGQLRSPDMVRHQD